MDTKSDNRKKENFEILNRKKVKTGNKIKLVAIDLDGTLFNSNSKISNANITVITECINRGISVVITTAKTIYWVKKLIISLNLKDPQIASAGAAIIDASFKPIYIRKIPFKSYAKIVNLSHEYKIGLGVSCIDGFVYYEKENPYLEYIWVTGEMPRKTKNLLDKSIANQVLLVTFTVDTEHVFNKIIVKELEKEIKIIRGGEYFLACHNKYTSKLSALKKILKILDIDKMDIMAIGDSESDIDIINFAGLGIAMGNASEAVKKNADVVVSDNNNDGVAEAINKFVLN